MAGLDFYVPVKPKERTFARAILNHLQKAARNRQCDRPTIFRFAWAKPNSEVTYHHYRVSVDGDFAEIQSFAVAAMNDSYHFGAGFVAANPQYRKSQIAEVVPIAFLREVMSFHDDLQELVGMVSSSTEVPAAANSYFFANTGHETVDRVLIVTSMALLDWRNGREPSTALAEQLHTAAEVTLKAVLNAPNRGCSFARLVTTAGDKGILIQSQVDTLQRLKNLRRDAKHRGQGIAAESLANLVPECVASIQGLVAQVRSNSANNSSQRTPLTGRRLTQALGAQWHTRTPNWRPKAQNFWCLGSC